MRIPLTSRTVTPVTQTPCSDDFSGGLGGWTNSSETDSLPVVVGGALSADQSGSGYAYCDLRHECDIGSSDYYVEVMVSALTETDDRIFLLARMNPGSGPNAYPGWYPINAVQFSTSGAPGTVKLDRYTSGSVAGPIGSAATIPALVVGDVLRMEVEGSTFRGFVNGVLYLSATDATNLTGQYAGVGLYTEDPAVNALAIDNYRAGPL